MILKTIYEISLSYGFDYETKEEQIYILNLICGALTIEEEKLEYNKKLEKLAEDIAKGNSITLDLEEEISNTSKVLSKSMLTSKFIQGLPLVGVLGGISNFKVISNISDFSKLKYKKRYLSMK